VAYEKVTGIVIRYVNYRDNDRILTIFTEEKGRVDAKARGCRRPKSPLLPCAQPFVFGEFQLYAGKERYTIDQCDVRESFYPLREDVERLAAGYAMLALTQTVIQQNQSNPGMFSALYHALSFLCYGDTHAVDMVICFIVRFLETNGVCPALTTCACCGESLLGARESRFSVIAGGAVCLACAAEGNALFVELLSLEAMRRMRRLADADMGRVKLPPAVRRELLRLLTAYMEYTLDKPLPALRTLENAGDI
jgi:DNA repair protein RecO (recombination protein O)